MILYGFNQQITEPAHILEHSFSCIDLIFSNQPNLVRDSGIHLSLYSKCHSSIIYSKLNSEINSAPLYTLEIKDYNRAETDLTNHSIESFDWSKLVLAKDKHEQVILFKQSNPKYFP